MTKPATFWNETTTQSAIYGTDYSTSQSFDASFTTSSSQITIAVAGAYQLCSDQNIYCVAGTNPTATVPTTQAGSPAGTFSVRADQPLTISLSAGKLAVIGVSASGTLTVN
jgi:hypothetical protein